MADIPELYRLNYPIETPEAQAFWSSRHKANRAKAIMAFSLDLDNANDNYRRWNYPRQFRKRALLNFCMYVNQPDMKGIPLSPLDSPWWEEMPYRTDSACGGGGGDIPVTGVTISPKTFSLSVGDTKQLSATVAPSNATNKSVTYSTSDATIATVSSSGLVTALKAGSVTITVKTADGGKTDTASGTISAAVSAAPVITSQPQNTSTAIGKTFSMSVVATGTGTLTYQWQERQAGGAWNSITHKEPSWTSTPATAVGTRTFRVIVTNTETGKNPTSVTSDAATVTITSASVPATGVSMDAFESLYFVGNQYKVPYHIEPANGTYDSIEFKVTTENDVDGAVSGSATIDASGNITVVNSDENPYVHTTIKVGSNTYHDSSHLVISTIGVHTDSFSNIPVGESVQFTFTATPDGVLDLPDCVVTYRSGDTSVATIDEKGILTSVADGRTSIYARVTVGNAYGEDSSSIGFDGLRMKTEE